MQDELNQLHNSMFIALQKAQAMQAKIFEEEGDSDLNRKFTHYLIPNLTHWLTGGQAGGIKDLTETLARREKK